MCTLYVLCMYFVYPLFVLEKAKKRWLFTDDSCEGRDGLSLSLVIYNYGICARIEATISLSQGMKNPFFLCHSPTSS